MLSHRFQHSRFPARVDTFDSPGARTDKPIARVWAIPRVSSRQEQILGIGTLAALASSGLDPAVSRNSWPQSGTRSAPAYPPTEPRQAESRFVVQSTWPVPRTTTTQSKDRPRPCSPRSTRPVTRDQLPRRLGLRRLGRPRGPGTRPQPPSSPCPAAFSSASFQPMESIDALRSEGINAHEAHLGNLSVPGAGGPSRPRIPAT